MGQTVMDTLIPKSPTEIKDMITSPQGITLIGCAIAFGILAMLEGEQKKILAQGRWAKQKEKKAAANKGKNQISQPSRNTVCFWIGTPSDFRYQQQKQFFLQAKKLGHQLPQPKKQQNPTLYIPDAQRGIAAIGAAGSGKTFGVIDPVIRSSLDQGFPTLIYDFKYPAQTKRAVAYARKRGYQVRVFAQGFPESDTCNPFDFLRDSGDAVAAGQLASVINRNIDKNIDKGAKGGDKFFEDAGDFLVEGIFLVIKRLGELRGREYADLMSASALLSVNKLPDRLEYAIWREVLGVWTSRPLQQLISVKDSEKTVAGIIATAQRVFQRFLKKDFIGAFCGETTLPLDVEGKQLIIFGLDRNNRDIVAPLLTAILHMVVSRNVSRSTPRQDPLVVSIDELPTIYLPQLVNWLNENREDGFCGILGFQNISQLEKAYGRELTRAIVGGCATKVILNPQDTESAKYFCDLIGEEEVKFKSKSSSTGSGKGGRSKSISEQRQKKHLFEPAQFSKLPTGKGIIINPCYGNKNESYIPLLTRLKIPQVDIDEQNWSESMWEMCRHQMIQIAQQRNPGIFEDEEARTQEFEARKACIDSIFVIPDEDLSMGAPMTAEDRLKHGLTNPSSDSSDLPAVIDTSESEDDCLPPTKIDLTYNPNV